MKKYALHLIITIIIVLTFAIDVNAQEVRVGAGAAATENILKPVKEHFEKATGLKLVIISSGPKHATIDLEKGAIDAAGVGMTFDDLLKLMKKEGEEVNDPASLQHITIGQDKIIVLIHKDNPVSKLSKEQLKGIFTGKVTNWKEVGGKDMPLMVVWGTLIPGTNSLFTRNILDGESQTKEVLEATTAEDIRQSVASNPEAIGIGPIAVIDATVRSPETPEIARPIIFITKGKPNANVQKLIDFIKTEGSKYIK